MTAVVNLRAEFDDKNVGIAPAHYLHLPTADDSAPALEQLQTGAVFVAEEVADGGSVYVHCGSGVGRAATMAAAYLVHTGLSPEQAWACIRRTRPFIRPTAVQIEQIARFASQRSAQCLLSSSPTPAAASSPP
jgi:protein-tyrosine phosphatase